MNTRPVARADRSVTVVGLGTRAFGGGLRGVEPEDVARVVPAAIEMGMSLLDVAPHWGEALRVTGAAVRSLRARDRVCIACHVPPVVASPSLARAQPPGYVQRTVEDALRALRLDAISLGWLGGWRDAWLDEKAWPELHGTLVRLVREGKVLAWGVAAPDGEPGEALRAVAEPWLTALSVRCSLFDRSAEEALLPAASAAGVAVIAREPLARGALGGEVGPTVRFRPEDERLGWSEARLTALVPELARLAALVSNPPPAAASTDAGRALLDGMRRGEDVTCATVPELALRSVIGMPGVTAAVVGARRVEHVAAATLCGDGTALSPRVRDVLAGRRWGEGWY
jgi:aryl-alcohol dehydrogenase-like predicted oxidoreductase